MAAADDDTECSLHDNPMFTGELNPLFSGEYISISLPRCPHEFDKDSAWLKQKFMDAAKFRSKTICRENPSCWDCFADVDKSEWIAKTKIPGAPATWLHPTDLCPSLMFDEMSIPWAKSSYGEGYQPRPVMAEGGDKYEPISTRIAKLKKWKVRGIDNIRCGDKKIGLCWYNYETRPRPPDPREPVEPFEHRPVEPPPVVPESRGWEYICSQWTARSHIRRESVNLYKLEFDKKGGNPCGAQKCIEYLEKCGVLYSDTGGFPSLQPPNYYSNSYQNNEILLVMSVVIITCLCACIVVYLFGVLTGYIGSKILSQNNAESQHEYDNGGMSVNVCK